MHNLLGAIMFQLVEWPWIIFIVQPLIMNFHVYLGCYVSQVGRTSCKWQMTGGIAVSEDGGSGQVSKYCQSG